MKDYTKNNPGNNNQELSPEMQKQKASFIFKIISYSSALFFFLISTLLYFGIILDEAVPERRNVIAIIFLIIAVIEFFFPYKIINLIIKINKYFIKK